MFEPLPSWITNRTYVKITKKRGSVDMEIVVNSCTIEEITWLDGRWTKWIRILASRLWMKRMKRRKYRLHVCFVGNHSRIRSLRNVDITSVCSTCSLHSSRIKLTLQMCDQAIHQITQVLCMRSSYIRNIQQGGKDYRKDRS